MASQNEKCHSKLGVLKAFLIKTNIQEPASAVLSLEKEKSIIW